MSSPAGKGDQSVEVKDLSMEPSSSNKLEKCKPKDYIHVINIFDEYDALLLSSEFDIDEDFDEAEAVNDACQNLPKQQYPSEDNFGKPGLCLKR